MYSTSEQKVWSSPTPISKTLPRRWRPECPRKIRSSPVQLLGYCSVMLSFWWWPTGWLPGKSSNFRAFRLGGISQNEALFGCVRVSVCHRPPAQGRPAGDSRQRRNASVARQDMRAREREVVSLFLGTDAPGPPNPGSAGFQFSQGIGSPIHNFTAGASRRSMPGQAVPKLST